MTSLNPQELMRRLETVEEILRASAKISLEGFSFNPGAQPAKLHSEEKTSFRDLVTEYDQKVESFILEKLSNSFPGETFIGEESSYLHSKKGAPDAEGLIWVIDPIDGTTNYSRSFPYFCTTIALMNKNGNNNTLLLGLTFDPVRNELFSAAKGQGAFFSQQGSPREKIRVSAISKLEQSLLVTGFASERATKQDVAFDRFMKLTRESLGVRRLGAAALDLAYVAIGRLDAYWEYGLSAWDVAAGALLVEEAGGSVSHFERKEEWSPWTGEILATNAHLHSLIKEKITAI